MSRARYPLAQLVSRSRRLSCCVAAFLLCSVPAFGQTTLVPSEPTNAPAPRPYTGRQVPIAGPLDPRVRTLTYQDEAVYLLAGHYGYQIMLEFGEDERIENVSIGDSLAWQVTPNRRADTLFLKPIEFDAATNMSVVTSMRRYVFQLTASEPRGADDPEIVFRVKFVYPVRPDEATQTTGPTAKAPEARNSAYSVSGSLQNLPSRVFDDGARTYFEWPKGVATPAIFALGADGSETVVNFSMVAGLMAVERTGPAFILRNGAEQTLVHNDAWRPPDPGPAAPQARPDTARKAERTQQGLWGRMFSRRPR
jgi:type IV secretion system protein VirB9